MDPVIARLDATVARCADAWLTDPTDHGLYGRLVKAVLERRAYLHPELDTAPEPETPTATQSDELLDELADHDPPRRVGDDDVPHRP